MGYQDPKAIPKGMKKYFSANKDFYPSGGIPIRTNFSTGSRPGLYANINARKKAGTSRSKENSTISSKNYANMKSGFKNS
jgi:hypothetical protein